MPPTLRTHDDQGAHGATRDSAKAEKSKAAKRKGASTANSTGKLDVKEKHALLDKMGERTKELKALMACGGEDTHPSPESAAPREEQATANPVCAETCRLVCTESSEEDLGDCDDIGFAGVVEQCLDNLSEGTLGEALTTHVVAPPIDTGGHTHTSKREPIAARYTNTATGSMKEGSKREPTAARYTNTATGSTKEGEQRAELGRRWEYRNGFNRRAS